MAELSDGTDWKDRSDEERRELIEKHMVRDRSELSSELREVAERWDREAAARVLESVERSV